MVFQRSHEQRLAGIGTVVFLHVLVIWALISGLGREIVKLLPQAPSVVLIAERPAAPEPPLRMVPTPRLDDPTRIQTFAPPPLDISPPSTQPLPPPRDDSQVAVLDPPGRQTAIPGAVRTEPVVKGTACREPVYPASAERLGQYGTVLLDLLVGLDGRVIDSRIARSSGYPSLDSAAQSALSSCRFTPGTLGGKPEAGWARLKYSFKPG